MGQLNLMARPHWELGFPMGGMSQETCCLPPVYIRFQALQLQDIFKRRVIRRTYICILALIWRGARGALSEETRKYYFSFYMTIMRFYTVIDGVEKRVNE